MATMYESLYSNATSHASTIWDMAVAATKPVAYDMYQGVDVNALNYFEKLWMSWYQYWGNPIIGTGILAFLMHEVVYFGRCVPWILLTQFLTLENGSYKKQKFLQRKQWMCTLYVLKTHFSVELPQIYLFHPMATMVGMSTYQVPFPSLISMGLQLSLFFVMEDAWHYFAHRALHYKGLYKHIHKLHHTYSAPFGLAAEYAHPIEVMVLGFGTVGSPLLYCWLSGGNMLLITMYIWITLRLFQAIDAHSGYDFPWSLNKFIPFWAGADHHDYHHQSFGDCYSTSFRYMDKFFGTDTKYHAFRNKQRQAKLAKKVE